MPALITLLTDFGRSDPYVGVMTGVIYSRASDVRIVDVSHGVPPQDIRWASYWLERAYAWFPRGTVHIAVIDPGVGTDRAVLVHEAHGHVFLVPDNGLLSHSLRSSADAVTRRVDVPALAYPTLSSTFHGRELFAPLAAELASAQRQPSELGEIAQNIVAPRLSETVTSPGRVDGHIVCVDHFGNLITNIELPARAAEERANLGLHLGEHAFSLVETYGQLEVGASGTLVNSFGTLEIVSRDASARRNYGDALGSPVSLRWSPK